MAMGVVQNHSLMSTSRSRMRAIDAAPRQTFVVHGDAVAADALRLRIKDAARNDLAESACQR